MNDRGQVFERVRSIMLETFPQSIDVPISRETTSSDVEGWDSLTHSMLIMNVEEAFGLDLPLDRTYELKDLGELADLVYSCQNGTA